MGKILEFKRPKRRGNTLCRHGHHKWQIDSERVFDTKAGKLVTRYQCSRCGAFKSKAH